MLLAQAPALPGVSLMNATAAVLLLGVPLVTGCVSRSVTCGPGTYQLSRAHTEAGNWRFVQVDADGSVVLERGGQTLRLHPDTERGWLSVVETDAANQTATIRMPHCDYRRHFLWWSWSVNDPEQDQFILSRSTEPTRD